MAKNKNQTQNQSDVKTEAIVIPPRQGSSPFKRIASVTLPTLKVEEGKPVFVMITDAIVSKQTVGKDDEGKPVLKMIDVMPIVNLETGELMTMVPGKALGQNLKDYKGGNGAYIGLCFELTKHPKPEGKRWKPWSIFEIQKPEGV